MDKEGRGLTTVKSVLDEVAVSATLLVGIFGIEWLKHGLFPAGAPWAAAMALNFSEMTLICAFLLPFLRIATSVVRQFKVLLHEVCAAEAWQVLASSGSVPIGRRLREALGWGLVIAAIIVAMLSLIAGLGLLNWLAILAVAVLVLIVGVILLSKSRDKTLSTDIGFKDGGMTEELKRNLTKPPLSKPPIDPTFVLFILLMLQLSCLAALLGAGPLAARLLGYLLITGPLAN